ncbi:hypothetical protein [Leptolyngbya sp. FACHB-17]|uniref:hypothetical protein n=1 Tax=unclassified Leptolyngbya TaxID=2650499 RepID=UPI00168057E5|nr:hypothetical protein [Leptolyngbya sp. FACHB-17]MBD2080863.1 hypothetical protein [Leptolyngbya sp. FACHB-17]
MSSIIVWITEFVVEVIVATIAQFFSEFVVGWIAEMAQTYIAEWLATLMTEMTQWLAELFSGTQR